MKMLTRLLVISALALLLPFQVQAVELVTYYHNDALGSPVAASDEFGQVLWRESYQPYGQRQAKDPKSQLNRRWFTGHVEDSDTGLVYMQARYYDPRLGRFMAVDPVGFVESSPQSFNRYAYANNNPYKFVDPDGEHPLFYALWTAGAFLVEVWAASSDVDLPGKPKSGKLAKEVGKKVKTDVTKGERKPGSAGIDRTGKDFTPKTKRELDAENAARNGGVNRCENCGVDVVPGQRSQRGVTPPGNERQRDHIIPKSKGGDGTLENGQILCRTCNLNKRDNL